MNFNWKEFEEGRILVHCNTEEETLDFLNKCRERGYQIHINEYNEYKKILIIFAIMIGLTLEVNILLLYSFIVRIIKQ